MEIINYLFDQRSECASILTIMSLDEYKNIAYKSYSQGGNIEGQRNVIKQSTVASKIRKRMNDDFVAGAVFPHVVVGLLLEQIDFEKVKSNPKLLPEHLNNSDKISIIDGMQRSNIYFNNYKGNESKSIRVEFWISNKTVKLLYRMLVLNTGQVPWNTRRQIEVIYSNLSQNIINAIAENYPDLSGQIDINGVDEGKRRTQAGKYKKSVMIELYLGFNTRKVKVNVNDELADEFQRFDMMESIEKDINFDFFVDAFSYLCKLDFAFSECKSNITEGEDTDGQYKEGKDIFGSIPACIGFVVAYSEYVIGKVSVERNDDVKVEKNRKIKKQIDAIIDVIRKNRDSNFISLESLNAMIKPQSQTRIGDEMRNTFKYIFSEMFKYEELGEISSMETFWRT